MNDDQKNEQQWAAFVETALKDPALQAWSQIIAQQKKQRRIKRALDILLSLLVLPIVLLPALVLAILIKLSSRGPVLYSQIRITQDFKPFRLYKFRSMRVQSDQEGLLTRDDDKRVTWIGAFMRETRLDEIPQIWNILRGDMSWVGPRPEVPRYIPHYEPEGWATLLVPAGLTCRASICYKDEAKLLGNQSGEKADQIYIKDILPEKTHLNLAEIQSWSIRQDLKTLGRTFAAILADLF